MIDLFTRAPHKGGKLFKVEEDIITEKTKYTLGDRIAHGGNGVVHNCIDNRTGDEFAIKFQLDTRDLRVQRFQREVQLINTVKHEHLIQYIDDGTVKANQYRGKKRKNTELSFIIMELAENNLFTALKPDQPKITYETYIAQFKGLANALGEIHNWAIHRDIKPHNILIAGDKWVLSDYGLCSFFDKSEDNITPDWEILGPRFWMSPEANNQAVGYDCEINKASDVFQLASVFWYVVTGRHPTGILRKEDWTGPESLFEPLFLALHHDISLRPEDGRIFAQTIEAAVLS